MSLTVPLAEYLFTRLRQLGVESIHGVPGDYNLNLLDFVAPCGLHWVGNVNELNAGYAADGYARIKGMGVLITTFGVGELSAINAIAGMYTERASVVHIVGTPEHATQDARLAVHHTLNDGDYRRFANMQAHVTVGQVSLRDPSTVPEEIDRVLRQCILYSRPVYIEVPVDLVSACVSAERLHNQLTLPEAPPTSKSDIATARILEKIYAAKQPLIMVAGECRPLGIVEGVQTLIKSTGWPTWTTPYGKGLFDESLPNFHGIYTGDYDGTAVQNLYNHADLVLLFGPHLSSSNTYNYSTIPKKSVRTTFTDNEVTVGDDVLRDVPARLAISQLIQQLDVNRIHRHNFPDGCSLLFSPKRDPLIFSDIARHERITHNKLWRLFSIFLRPGDIILGETGTAGYGVRELVLPPRTRMFAPATWLSIGYMLPAAQGAALAQRELQTQRSHACMENSGRTILFIGDGSFQVTVQELSTIIRNDLNILVFLINNNGYTIERVIHGLHETYNDIGSWRYLQAPSFFGAPKDAFTAAASTWDQLERVLADERVTDDTGLRIVELLLDREDVPDGPLVEYREKERHRVGSIDPSLKS